MAGRSEVADSAKSNYARPSFSTSSTLRPTVPVLKIIAGEFRSRRLATPPDESTRPMASRTKESIFNLLRGWFDDAIVLDLFAGVGTMGLEAISRGAAKAIMVERSRDIFRLLEQNIATLGCSDRTMAINADALSAEVLAVVPTPVDVLFIDPPYATMEEEAGRARVFEQVRRCRQLMGSKGFVVLRTPLDPATVSHRIEGFDGPEVHRYGPTMHVALYAPQAPSARSESSASPGSPGSIGGDDRGVA